MPTSVFMFVEFLYSGEELIIGVYLGDLYLGVEFIFGGRAYIPEF